MTNTHQASDYVFAPQLQVEDEAGDHYNALLRGMTHKLNNMLGVIHGFSSLILMEDRLPASVVENLGHIKEAAEGVSGLNEAVMAAGGCARVEPQAIHLTDFIGMAENTLREPSLRLDVPFTLTVPPDIPGVRADTSRLKEVLLAILKNAAEAATDNNGTVSMDITPPGVSTPGSDHVDLFIHNTGPVIPTDRAGLVFSPFYTTKDSSHYGIGLTGAAVLCGLMGISLGLRSTGGLTTFWLQIPVA